MSKVIITFDTVEKSATCLVDGELLDDFSGAYISCNEDGPSYMEIMVCEEDEEDGMKTHTRITSKEQK